MSEKKVDIICTYQGYRSPVIDEIAEKLKKEVFHHAENGLDPDGQTQCGGE